MRLTDLTDEAKTEVEDHVRSLAALAVLWGDYDDTPRYTAVRLARAAFEAAGIPASDWDAGTVEWAKRLVERVLSAEGAVLRPGITDLISTLEFGFDAAEDGPVNENPDDNKPMLTVGENEDGPIYAATPNPDDDTPVWQAGWANTPVPLRELREGSDAELGEFKLYPPEQIVPDVPVE